MDISIFNLFDNTDLGVPGRAKRRRLVWPAWFEFRDRERHRIPFGWLGHLYLPEDIEGDRGQGGDLGFDVGDAFMDDLPGGFVVFAAIFTGDVEPEEVGGGFSVEVLF